MAGYILVDIKVSDPLRYEVYKKLASEAIAKHGGRYLVRGGESVLLEGTEHPNRVVVLEFPSLEKARAFYDSTEYVAARAAREGAAVMNMVAVAGL
ncbi:MAG: DUF1330 domain-containing protein [Betaproteobacteria bacterium]